MRPLCLLGHPVEHSLSPALLNAALAASGLAHAYHYHAADVPPARLREAVLGLRALGYAGANVTTPHKTLVGALCDTLSEMAQAAGSVNVLSVDRNTGAVSGDSTDGEGLLRALAEAGAEVRGAAALVVGAGGAARAAVVALRAAGAVRVACAARRTEAAAATGADEVALLPASHALAGALAASTIVVHCTTLGLHAGDALPLDETALAALPENAFVLDMVYRSQDTALVRAARARGLQACDGVPMLVHQAALAFERWTGLPAPLDAMRAATRRG